MNSQDGQIWPTLLNALICLQLDQCQSFPAIAMSWKHSRVTVTVVCATLFRHFAWCCCHHRILLLIFSVLWASGITSIATLKARLPLTSSLPLSPPAPLPPLLHSGCLECLNTEPKSPLPCLVCLPFCLSVCPLCPSRSTTRPMWSPAPKSLFPLLLWYTVRLHCCLDASMAVRLCSNCLPPFTFSQVVCSAFWGVIALSMAMVCFPWGFAELPRCET